MSKDKLKEIRDNYWLSLSNEYTYTPPPDIDDDDLEYLMKLAYNQALNDFSIEITKYEYDYKNINELLTKLKL